MTADAPTILATSGGLRPAQRNLFGFGPLLTYAIDLAGVSGRAPRVCYVGTAGGDQAWFAESFIEAGRVAGADVSPLRLFTMPNVDDMAGFVLDQDVVWVSGGSVANLLALWRPLFHRLVADGTLPAGYATDDHVGLLYRGTELAEAVTEVRGQGAYRVTAEDGEVREERLTTRVLPGGA